MNGDSNRNRTYRRGQKPKPRPETRKFITVSWSGQREPLDNIVWCEAERVGEWLVFTALEQLRTRREVLELLSDRTEGIAGLEFSFGYPSDFFEMMAGELGFGTWREMIHRIREDLKKNSDDGVRLWIDRMGKYRESQLESAPPARENFRRGSQREEPRSAQELRSRAERFRKTELTIRRAAEDHVLSSLNIGFNRLTGRYEFLDPEVRGKGALLGMSMLDQLIELNPDAHIWPFQKPSKLTIVELQPWVFTKGKTMDAPSLRKYLATEEDIGTEIPTHFRDFAMRNPVAQRMLVSLLGLVKTERREIKTVRPLRDYSQNIYEDERIQKEGWYYGINYKPSEEVVHNGVADKREPANQSRPNTRKIVLNPPTSMNEESPSTPPREKPVEAESSIMEVLRSDGYAYDPHRDIRRI